MLINKPIFNVKCGGCPDMYERCSTLIDARCVLYLGKGTDGIVKVKSGDDVQYVIERLKKEVDFISRGITNLSSYFESSVSEIKNDISEVDLGRKVLDDRVTDIVNTFCERVATCPKVVGIKERVDILINTFCEKAVACAAGK